MYRALPRQEGKPRGHCGNLHRHTDAPPSEAVCPYLNARCCEDPTCCEKDEAEDMPPECNP